MAILHGWIQNYDATDYAEELSFEANRKYGLISHPVEMNGTVCCHFYSCRNHFGISFERLFEKLRKMVEKDKDVFGLIYVYDDENQIFPDDWQVLVIKNGFIEKRTDPFLSPWFEKIYNPETDLD